MLSLYVMHHLYSDLPWMCFAKTTFGTVKPVHDAADQWRILFLSTEQESSAVF